MADILFVRCEILCGSQYICTILLFDAIIEEDIHNVVNIHTHTKNNIGCYGWRAVWDRSVVTVVSATLFRTKLYHEHHNYTSHSLQ